MADPTPIPAPMEDELPHTNTSPFCSDPSCLCHVSPPLIAQVAQAVSDGLLTPGEASQFVAGKTLSSVDQHRKERSPMSQQQGTRRCSSLRAAAWQAPGPKPQFPYLDAPPPAEWMPLDEVAQAWADFGAHAHEAAGWQATSLAFAAMSQENEALHHSATWQASHAAGYSALRLDWHFERVTSGLYEALALWQKALFTLDEWSQQQPATETDDEERTRARTLAQLSRWHQWRISGLLARLYQERNAVAAAMENAPQRLHLGHLPMEQEARVAPEPELPIQRKARA